MKFNSQICTTRSQSEALLKLGLKKETADMTHHYLNSIDSYELKDIEFSRIMHLQELTNKNPILGRSGDDLYAKDIPAWSLHRLIEMVAGGSEEQMIFLPDPYDELIEEIAGAIMVGCFPKEYLDGLDSKR